MSFLEAENMELRARVSELEGNQNVASHTQTPDFPTSVTQQEDTHDVHNTPSSPVSSLISRVIEETQHLQTSSSSPLSTLFENGADVEIATSDDATCRIWYLGNVFATNLCDGVEKVAVILFADQKRVTVTADKIRPKPPTDDREKKFEMMDNVEAFYSKGWSSGQVRMILGENTFSVYLNSSMQTLEFKASDLRIHREWLDGVWKMADEENNSSAKRSSCFSSMRREEANSTRNPPMHVTPKVILPIDPFVTPEFPLFSRLGYWMQLCCIHYNRNKIEKDFFEYLDNAENNLKEKHVDAAFAMLNQKRIEQSSWFSEQGIPKACFVPGWVGEVVRGLIRPNKMWMLDVDIVYGVVHERLVDHFIGGGDTSDGEHNHNLSLWRSQVLIPAIKLEMMNEEINFNDIIPFQVKKAEGLPKTKITFNCGLFVVKMLECRSLGLKKMSSINDDTAMDLRSKLCCEMFDQFMDKDFQEGCRRMVALLFKQFVLVSLCESTVKSLNC
ncbi:hypothetical protein Bca52824_072311 [Brassica carinata]|uniref:Agenet domain-containing protein n=2 Tax=Brassica TaxID=3705 RepID=A0A8X7U451_BRACI|nr:hypothetical protein Bca52824_072311 [Brassica carinata]